jgi:transcriptional regulator with XRE-family HTH domain
MGNCAKLKWNRKRLGLTQKQFAEKVGVHVGTIQKLETDETAWGTIQQSTEDKISAFYDSMASWQPKRADKVVREIKDELNNESEVVKEEIVIPEPVKVIEPVHNDNGLTENDNKTLILMEFAFEGLKESKTHEDFVANINMMKRIIKQY